MPKMFDLIPLVLHPAQQQALVSELCARQLQWKTSYASYDHLSHYSCATKGMILLPADITQHIDQNLASI